MYRKYDAVFTSHQIYPTKLFEKTNDWKSNPMIKTKIPFNTATRAFLHQTVIKKANDTIAMPKRINVTIRTKKLVLVNTSNRNMNPRKQVIIEQIITSQAFEKK